MGILILFYCGIDVAKNNHEASIIDARGKLLAESTSFPNFKKGCEKFDIIPKNIIIGMETTEYYWFSFYSFFSLKSIAETSFGISSLLFKIKQIIFIQNQIEVLEKQISILLLKTNQVITTIFLESVKL